MSDQTVPEADEPERLDAPNQQVVRPDLEGVDAVDPDAPDVVVNVDESSSSSGDDDGDGADDEDL